MIKNGVIINGVTYELSSINMQGDQCAECALHEMCKERFFKYNSTILCDTLFDDCSHKAFKRVE